MNPVTIIRFDATTFSADESLVQLLHAKAICNELSPLNIHNAVFMNTLYKGGDSSDNSGQLHSHLTNTLLQLFSMAQTIARPKAFYYIAGHHNAISLPVNVAHTFPVYPFIATVGLQFDTWLKEFAIISQQYCAHIIGMWLLHRCVQKLACTIGLGDSFCILYPGSLEALPVTYNHMLYSLFANEAQRTGITLNDECMFSPLHTVAGFMLPHTDTGNNNCTACTLQQCQFRNILT